MMPALRGLEKSESGVFLTVPMTVAMKMYFVVDEFLHRQDGVDLFALFQREEIDDRLAAAGAAALRRFVNLQPVAAAAVGEAQDVVVGIGDEQVIDEILILDRRRLLAATAAALGAVVGKRLVLM